MQMMTINGVELVKCTCGRMIMKGAKCKCRSQYPQVEHRRSEYKKVTKSGRHGHYSHGTKWCEKV